MLSLHPAPLLERRKPNFLIDVRVMCVEGGAQVGGRERGDGEILEDLVRGRLP